MIGARDLQSVHKAAAHHNAVAREREREREERERERPVGLNA